MYLLGYDIGSSSVKVALVQADNGATIATAHHPPSEMAIRSDHPGWAEQDPESWWNCLCIATRALLQKTAVSPAAIQSIGIAYQMHGLVLVDENHQALRPAIIWCDSRAVAYGMRAFDDLGHDRCFKHLLNSPGNFTAAKLKWVQENEPEVYGRIYKFMLPGDYIALRLTGEALTTPGGLSEAILWDFQKDEIAGFVLDYFGIEKKLLPDIRPSLSAQGVLTKSAADATGLVPGIPLTYRAGDQPNNALSLHVLKPGQIAASGGTSGVVYGLLDRPVFDPLSRVNGFLHVNHTKAEPRIGILLCINGTGILYNWLRQNIGLNGISYRDMERLAAQAPVGSDGLHVLPFGNGAERMLENRNPGAQICNLDFNRHNTATLYRAALEGIAFAFVHGVEMMKKMGVVVSVMRAGSDNLFQSVIFARTVATLLDCSIEIVETAGAAGAAKASGVAAGAYKSIEVALGSTKVTGYLDPLSETAAYHQAYRAWESALERYI